MHSICLQTWVECQGFSYKPKPYLYEIKKNIMFQCNTYINKLILLSTIRQRGYMRIHVIARDIFSVDKCGTEDLILRIL